MVVVNFGTMKTLVLFAVVLGVALGKIISFVLI